MTSYGMIRSKVATNIKNANVLVKSDMMPNELLAENTKIFVNFSSLAEFSKYFKDLLQCSETNSTISLTGTVVEWSFIMNYCYSNILLADKSIRFDKLLILLDYIMFDQAAIEEIIKYILNSRYADESKNIEENLWKDVHLNYMKFITNHLISVYETFHWSGYKINRYVHNILTQYDPVLLANIYFNHLNQFGPDGKHRFSDRHDTD